MMLAEATPGESVPSAYALADLMTRRRSVRRLQHGSLTHEALARIVEAARLTPSAYNRPVWRVVIIHERREPFWDLVEAAFRTELEGDRLARYLKRLEGFRNGIGAILVYEDRQAVEEMQNAYGIDLLTAQAFSEQALGMVQLALWLAIVAEDLATSLQHWESLIEERVADFLDLPADRFRLVATMPLGYAAEEPRPAELPDPRHVISLDAYAEGGSLGKRTERSQALPH